MNQLTGYRVIQKLKGVTIKAIANVSASANNPPAKIGPFGP